MKKERDLTLAPGESTRKADGSLMDAAGRVLL